MVGVLFVKRLSDSLNRKVFHHISLGLAQPLGKLCSTNIRRSRVRPAGRNTYDDPLCGSDHRLQLFICAASDDDLGLATHSVHIYLKWLEAKQPAELHMYEQGKHGFGTKTQGLPVDSWMDRFTDWLTMHSF